MIIQYFNLVTAHLIELMVVGLGVALLFRYLAYKSGYRNRTYFITFASAIQKNLHKEEKRNKIDNIEGWLDKLLDDVIAQLPSRSLRFSQEPHSIQQDQKSFRNRDREGVLFQEFAEGRKSIKHSIYQQIDAFRSPQKPDFHEITSRVLSMDKKWNYLFGVLPYSTLSSMLAILPGLFIVCGIFGTFIGITSALPKVASIDLSNLDAAAPILSSFVSDVAFSMNTSIAGIICSVVMTILNTVFPFHHLRNEVRASLERCFEVVWNRIHGNELTSAEEKTLSLLEGIKLELEKINQNVNIKQSSDDTKAA